jgi:hypothetical protein
MKITRQQVLVMVGFMVSGLLIFAAGCCFEKYPAHEPEEVAVEKPAAKEEVAEKTFTANQFCAACHYAFGEEKLALTHEKAGIGCERCHGESERHRSDEDNVTPPEIMFPKDKIIPTCMMCHPRHEIQHVNRHQRLLAGAKTIFDSDSQTKGRQIYCTTCHAKEHRINVRTIRWNKATGEILEE